MNNNNINNNKTLAIFDLKHLTILAILTNINNNKHITILANIFLLSHILLLFHSHKCFWNALQNMKNLKSISRFGLGIVR